MKEQISPSDSEQTPPVWTPKSAAASPTLERKAFRPVNFDSPKLSRRTLNNEPVEVSGVLCVTMLLLLNGAFKCWEEECELYNGCYDASWCLYGL